MARLWLACLLVSVLMLVGTPGASTEGKPKKRKKKRLKLQSDEWDLMQLITRIEDAQELYSQYRTNEALAIYHDITLADTSGLSAQEADLVGQACFQLATIYALGSIDDGLGVNYSLSARYFWQSLDLLEDPKLKNTAVLMFCNFFILEPPLLLTQEYEDALQNISAETNSHLHLRARALYTLGMVAYFEYRDNVGKKLCQTALELATTSMEREQRRNHSTFSWEVFNAAESTVMEAAACLKNFDGLEESAAQPGPDSIAALDPEERAAACATRAAASRNVSVARSLAAYQAWSPGMPFGLYQDGESVPGASNAADASTVGYVLPTPGGSANESPAPAECEDNQRPGQKHLLEEAIVNHLNARVRRLLEDTSMGPDDVLNSRGMPGLHLAVVHGNLGAAQMMVEYGADVHNLLPGTGTTPALLATRLGNAALVEMICQSDTYDRLPFGGPEGVAKHTLLYDAAWNGHLEVVRVLLAYAASSGPPPDRQLPRLLNISSLAGITPPTTDGVDMVLGHCEGKSLSLADGVNCSHQEAVAQRTKSTLRASQKQLLRVGPSLATDVVTPGNVYPAAHLAAFRGHVSVLKMLVEKANNSANLVALDGTTPLTLAAHAGHLDVVRYLLDGKMLHPPASESQDSAQWLPRRVNSTNGGSRVAPLSESEQSVVRKKSLLPLQLVDMEHGRIVDPIFAAIASSHLEVAAALLESGLFQPRHEYETQVGTTALAMVIKYAVGLRHQLRPLNTDARSSGSAPSLAAPPEEREISLAARVARLLVLRGAKPDAPSTRRFEHLMNHGISMQIDVGVSPIDVAVAASDIGILQLLIVHGSCTKLPHSTWLVPDAKPTSRNEHTTASVSAAVPLTCLEVATEEATSMLVGLAKKLHRGSSPETIGEGKHDRVVKGIQSASDDDFAADVSAVLHQALQGSLVEDTHVLTLTGTASASVRGAAVTNGTSSWDTSGIGKGASTVLGADHVGSDLANNRLGKEPVAKVVAAALEDLGSVSGTPARGGSPVVGTAGMGTLQGVNYADGAHRSQHEVTPSPHFDWTETAPAVISTVTAFASGVFVGIIALYAAWVLRPDLLLGAVRTLSAFSPIEREEGKGNKKKHRNSGDAPGNSSSNSNSSTGCSEGQVLEAARRLSSMVKSRYTRAGADEPSRRASALLENVVRDVAAVLGSGSSDFKHQPDSLGGGGASVVEPRASLRFRSESESSRGSRGSADGTGQGPPRSNRVVRQRDVDALVEAHSKRIAELQAIIVGQKKQAERFQSLHMRAIERNASLEQIAEQRAKKLEELSGGAEEHEKQRQTLLAQTEAKLANALSEAEQDRQRFESALAVARSTIETLRKTAKSQPQQRHHPQRRNITSSVAGATGSTGRNDNSPTVGAISTKPLKHPKKQQREKGVSGKAATSRDGISNSNRTRRPPKRGQRGSSRGSDRSPLSAPVPRREELVGGSEGSPQNTELPPPELLHLHQQVLGSRSTGNSTAKISANDSFRDPELLPATTSGVLSSIWRSSETPTATADQDVEGWLPSGLDLSSGLAALAGVHRLGGGPGEQNATNTGVRHESQELSGNPKHSQSDDDWKHPPVNAATW